MADFAVHHEGIPEGQARWVLHLDAATNRVLLCDEDKRFYWQDIDVCTLGAVHTPSQPTAVVIAGQIAPQQQAGLVVAEPNRTMRRNGHNGF